MPNLQKCRLLLATPHTRHQSTFFFRAFFLYKKKPQILQKLSQGKKTHKLLKIIKRLFFALSLYVCFKQTAPRATLLELTSWFQTPSKLASFAQRENK